MSDPDKHANHWFKTMADHAPVLLWVAREDGLCTFFNSIWIEFTGRTLEQEWGIGWTEGIHPEDFQFCMDTYIAAFNRREAFEMRYRLMRHDGEYRWLLDRGAPVFEGEQFQGFIGSCIDITDIHNAGIILEQRNHDLAIARKKSDTMASKFMAAIKAAPSGMLMVDPNGNIVLTNEKIECIFGYTSNELQGKTLRLIIPEAADIDSVNKEFIGIRKDGTTVPLEIGLAPIDTEEGHFVITSVVDISGHKKNEERLLNLAQTLERSNAELEKSNQELENFAYLASHDLQEPMRTIASFAGLIKEQLQESADPEVVRYLDILCKSARDMKALLQALLTYSRVSGKRTAPFSPINLQELLQPLADEMIIAPGNIKFDIKPLPVIPGDILLLKHLFMNLLSNAQKFRKPNQEALVTISSEAIAMGWRITVADQGIGMETNFMKRAFAIFSRGERSADIPGTGIGLAVCKKIASIHHGKIWCESVRGEGSKFHIEFPNGDAF